jgi:hypothetical protein
LAAADLENLTTRISERVCQQYTVSGWEDAGLLPGVPLCVCRQLQCFKDMWAT